MITLKPFLDAGREDLFALTADSYEATLKALAENAARCCPPTGKALQAELSAAAKALRSDASAKAIKAMQKQVLKALSFWGAQSETYFKRKAVEVKEILIELTKTADFVGKRDQRYTRQFHEITAHLEAIAQLDDLSKVRSSILHSAGELRGCVERMAREGADSISHLQESLATHRVELERAQELASLDPLTGLFNRREVEARIAAGLRSALPSAWSSSTSTASKRSTTGTAIWLAMKFSGRSRRNSGSSPAKTTSSAAGEATNSS